MEKMSYNDRVFLLAKEMAECTWMHYMDMPLSDTTPAHQERQIEIKMPHARIAVAKMAEACRETLDYFTDEYHIQKLLTEYGLVPDEPAEATTENNNWKL